jgi:uncharacterized membrane protein
MFWIIVLGFATGMRTVTPIAVFCWFTWFAAIPTTPLTWWTANIFSTAVFTVLALGEYYGDTLPQTPSRTKLPLMLSRVAFACFLGVLIASSFVEPLAGGVLFGLIGALAGTYGCHRARITLAKRVGSDLPVALGESALALTLSIVSMHYISGNIASFAHFTFH